MLSRSLSAKLSGKLNGRLSKNWASAHRAVIFVLVLISSHGCIATTAPKVAMNINDLAPGQYEMDKHHATLLFKVAHMGLAPYVGRFNEFSATVTIDPATPENTMVTATIQTASLDVNFPKFSEDLTGPNWFNSAAYPEATFRSTSVTWQSETAATAVGELTLLGVTKPVTMQVTFNGATKHMMTGNPIAGFSAVMTFNRSEFGLDKYPGPVGEEVTVEIYAEFGKK